MAEQLTLNQIPRDGCAVDLDVGLGAPQAVAIEFAPDHFLAGTTLASDQNGGIRRANPLDHLTQVLHRGAVTDELAHRTLPLAEIAVDPQELAVRFRLLQDDLDLAGRERLDQVVESTGAHAGDRAVDRPVASDDDHGRRFRQQTDAFKKLLSIAVRHAHIDKDQVERSPRHQGLRFRETAGRAHGAIFAAEDFAQDVPDDYFIMQDEVFSSDMTGGGKRGGNGCSTR